MASLGLIGATVLAAGPAAQAAVTAGSGGQTRQAARPSVSKVTPSSGSTAGGTRVTVSGKNFTGVRAVDFGSAQGRQLKVASSTRLTVISPRHAAGLAGVKVITAAGSSASVAADHYTYVTPPGPVTAAGVLAATPHSLTLAWTNPASKALTGVTIRRATGAKPPGSVTSGQPVATTKPGTSQYTVSGLRAGTTYSFALFARGRAGTAAAADTLTTKTNRLLRVSTARLPEGKAGESYLAALTATGGVGPYSWAARGLPRGLRLSPSGVLTGFPAGTGTSKVTVQVIDARQAKATATLSLAVPTALPSACAAKSCSVVTDDGATVQVPATDVVSVTRDSTSGAVTGATLSGISVAAHDVLVLGAGSSLPTGLIAVAGTVTSNGDGTTTVTLTPGTVGDAYDTGTVQALGPVSNGTTRARPQASGARPHASSSGSLDCGTGVTSSLHGLNVTHQLTPTVTAIWKHPHLKVGGFYPGSGGLNMFYAGLDGTVTVNMGITVSGSATCSLDLPSAEVAFPAGELGEIDLDVKPSLTFTVTGGIDVRATVTLHCGAYYEWTSSHGSSGGQYCIPAFTPPKLSTPGAIDASLAGALDVSLTLDDTTGVTGSIDATAHLGFRPGQHPAAELDASSTWDIKGVLAKWWKGGPTVTIASGTLLDHKVLWSSNSAPPPPTASTNWTGTEAPLPSDARSNAFLSLSHVACESAGSCVAVGEYYGADLDGNGLIETLSGGTWSPMAAPLPPQLSNTPMYSTGLGSVACPSTSSCIAVGSYEDATANQNVGPLIETLHNGSWTGVVAPLPTGGSGGALSAISCPSATFCVAIGTFSDSKDNNAGLIETLSGGSWTATEAPAPPGAASPEVSSVSCGAVGSCVAVTEFSNAIDTLANGTWKGTSGPLPADANPTPPPGQGTNFNSVACPAAGSCVIAGIYSSKSDGEQGMLDQLASGKWTASKERLPADANPTATAVLNSVTCTSSRSCLALGGYNEDGGGYFEGNLDTLSGGTWTAITAPTPNGGDVAGLSAASCIATSCVAVGYYGANAGGLIDTGSGGKWTATAPPLPSNAGTGSGGLDSVTCTASGFCVAIGSYVDNAGHGEGLLETR